MAKTDFLNDLRPVTLTERLARFIGALDLHARGLLSDRMLEEKLDQLKLSCRAADALLRGECDPEAVAAAMHGQLTS